MTPGTSFGRKAALYAAVSLIACAAASAARAQGYGSGALPSSDAAVRTGDLRAHFEQAAAAAAGTTGVTGPAWQITPSIDVSEVLTDNAYAGASGKAQWDLYTVLTPGLNVAGDTQRLKLNFSYSPSVSIYTRNSSLDQIGQNLNGTAHGILIPETLFLDLRAFGGLQSLSGGVANSTVTGQNRQDQNQTYSFSAMPYVQHRFGSLGLGEVGYTVSYGSSENATGLNGQNASTTAQVNPQLLAMEQQLSQNANSNVITQTEHASLTSGEDFGRFNLRAYGSATQYSGSGIYAHSRNNFGTLDAGYAINRTIAVIGEVGYEDIAYSGVPPFKVNDVIWAAGTKVTPNADSSITATYGHRYGRPNIFVDAGYSATARLRFFGRYSQSLTTNLQDVQNTLSQIDIDAAGGVYDHATGSPVAVVDDFFGLQSGVFRLDRGSLNAVLIYDRDTYSVAVSREQRKVVSADPSAFGSGSSRGAYGSVAWSHDLNPVVTTNLYGQFGRSTQTGFFASSGNSYTATASVTYAMSPTLSLTGLYTHQKTTTFASSQNSDQNYALVGLHKRF